MIRFPHGERVVRHPFLRFVTDGWGESRVAEFGPDEEHGPAGFDPSGTDEPGADSTVVRNPALYFDWLPESFEALPEDAAHDEWTVRGQRYKASGVPAHYKHPMTGWDAGWVVRLERRTG